MVLVLTNMKYEQEKGFILKFMASFMIWFIYPNLEQHEASK